MFHSTGVARAMRRPSSTRAGGPFDASTIQAVWELGLTAFGDYRVVNPATHRFDTCGALIERSKYGDTNNNFGWEIDHILPVAKGGTDSLSNLQPLQWQNNRRKGDGIFSNPADYCAVRYDGKTNR